MILLVGLIAVGLTSAAFAGKPVQLGASWQGGWQSSPWIEQEDDWPKGFNCLDASGAPLPDCDPRVITDGGWGLWGVNEHGDETTLGSLYPGESASRSKQVVHDYDPVSAWRNGLFSSHWNNADHGYSTARLLARSPNMVLSVCFEAVDPPTLGSLPTRCFYPQPKQVERRAWEWTFCGHAHFTRSDPSLVELAGTNGGHGVVTRVTTTATSTATKRVDDIYFMHGYASDLGVYFGWQDAYGCGAYPAYTDQADYPYFWTM